MLLRYTHTVRPSGAIQRVASFTIPLLIYCMWIFTKLTLMEVLLIIGLCMLGILIWEVHNTPGRYTKPEVMGKNQSFDTATGKGWELVDFRNSKKETRWEQVMPAIPNRSHTLK